MLLRSITALTIRNLSMQFSAAQSRKRTLVQSADARNGELPRVLSFSLWDRLGVVRSSTAALFFSLTKRSELYRALQRRSPTARRLISSRRLAMARGLARSVSRTLA